MGASERARRVVIVGAGFAGVEAAKTLAKNGVDVLLIDRHNYHTFIPMLYQVATAVLYPHQVVYPLRRLFRKFPQVRFVQTEVEKIDVERQIIHHKGVGINYDYLVIATGAQTRYFGVPGAQNHSLSMRTLPEAIALRNWIFSKFEEAAKTIDIEKRQRLLTFVIVGGGPTGVELAGALKELLDSILRKDYLCLNPKQARVILLQSGEDLLSSYPQDLGKYAARFLRNCGVKVNFNSKVCKVTQEAVYLEDGNTLFTNTVIWTAGVVAATSLVKQNIAAADREKIIVKPTLQIRDYPNVYAVGDLSYVESQGQDFNGVAQEAIQQGRTAANNILRQLIGKSPQQFAYYNKGRLAIIGRHGGVGKIGKFAFKGVLAWWMWLYVHLFYLPGIRNRMGVLFNWLKCYFEGEGASRIAINNTICNNKD
ncbi:MAG: NAD(P)/FAD-dependent oxidoreductase [Mastigocoleus sp. MO_167.B18]|uniref:NAD(P)/FAD-dependent oxidoreductase n=1 Tax=Mastigocoleus sp. MO_188.B34 TaxID=3036635 RepID=UPI00262B6FED|nr:NAD(P)/FAD-dependent oxidoreductase [Mastigocoleus sp. MO_188.B34]MDJ0693305.1 NAD(P)/FAD-dependent oxidoreductase [Mastigocoleus sp. MO_188.B34]MDJ0774423.1 NAD(P)/FAD-dependent oxidoreductase [Mastigocoleus sp. MO_167.B18]